MRLAATFLRASHAAEYAANVARTSGAIDITRTGRVVTFTAPADDSYDSFGDLLLTVHEYGGPRAKLAAVAADREAGRR